MLRPVDRRKKKRTGNALSEWLNQIQQDSWQLELIISGVVIFLLLEVIGPVEDFGNSIHYRHIAFDHTADMMTLTLLSFLLIGIYIITAGFIIHLIFRGFWIGAVGLRSVSGGYDYDALRFVPRFDGWLRNKLGTYDAFIEKLETRSSIVFSLAFLLFFSALSAALFFGLLIVIVVTIQSVAESFPPGSTLRRLSIVLIVFTTLFILTSGLLYLIDFITLGVFKRSRYWSKIYFPIYRMMGWFTMARFYRPIYYNLIDHPFGRRLVKYVTPLIFLFLLVTSIRLGRAAYTPPNEATPYTIKDNSYLTTEEGIDLKLPSLATYYPETDYLEVFFPTIGTEVNKVLEYRFPKLRETTERSFGFSELLDVYREDIASDSLLEAHRFIHHVYLDDSLLAYAPWKFYHHPQRDQHGLVYALPIYDLERGEHCLRFERLEVVRRDSLRWEDQGTLCFVR